VIVSHRGAGGEVSIFSGSLGIFSQGIAAALFAYPVSPVATVEASAWSRYTGSLCSASSLGHRRPPFSALPRLQSLLISCVPTGLLVICSIIDIGSHLSPSCTCLAPGRRRSESRPSWITTLGCPWHSDNGKPPGLPRPRLKIEGL